MAAFDAILASIGVEDVLRGAGVTAIVPTSDGSTTRTIHSFSDYFLDAGHNGTFSANYDFEGIVTFTSDGAVEFENGFTVSNGDVTIGGTGLAVNAAALFGSTVGIVGAVSLTAGLTVGTTVAVGTNLTVTGNSTLPTIIGATTASGAWTHTGTLTTTESVVLANGSGKTVQMGASGTADTTAVGTHYGKHTFEGNVVFNGTVTGVSSLSVTTLEAVTCEVDGVAGSQALRTSTFYASGAAQVDGLLTADGGIEIDGKAFGYSSGLGQFTMAAGLYVAGDLTVTGAISFASTATSLTVADYINFGTSAEIRATGVTQITASATLDISNKNIIYLNDTSGGGTTVTAVTSGGHSHFVYLYSMSTCTDLLTISASLMESGVALAMVAGKGCVLFWNEGTGKFAAFHNL